MQQINVMDDTLYLIVLKCYQSPVIKSEFKIFRWRFSHKK